MAKDIENVIQNIMESDDKQTKKPRDLIPFLLTANEILHRDIPQKRFLVSSFMPTSSFGMVFAPRGIGISRPTLALRFASALFSFINLSCLIFEAINLSIPSLVLGPLLYPP